MDLAAQAGLKTIASAPQAPCMGLPMGERWISDLQGWRNCSGHGSFLLAIPTTSGFEGQESRIYLWRGPGGRGGEALHRQMAGTPPGHRSHAEASLTSSLQLKTEPREQTASKGAKIYHELITIGHPSSDFYKTPV